MKRLAGIDMVKQLAPVRSYWIIDGVEKTFFAKEQLKQIGARYDKTLGSWYIVNPTEGHVEQIKKMGLKMQHRRYGA